MKIITKKSVIFAALAVVLLATALIISCNAPLDGDSDKEEPSKPGTGKVRLTINNKNYNRTIFPTGLPTNVKYLVILGGSAAGNFGNTAALDPFYATVNAGTTVNVNNVPIGGYSSVQVIVYASDTELDNNNVSAASVYEAVAIGESAQQTNGSTGYVVAPAGTPTSLGSHTTTLYTPGSKSGTGKLSYTINKSGGGTSRLGSASFVIKGRGIADVAGTNTVSFGIGGEVDNIPAGYYNVVYTLNDTTNTHTAYFYEILHVYKGMTSILTRSLDDTVLPTPSNVGKGQFTEIKAPPVGVILLTGVLSTTTPGVTVDDTSNYGYSVEIPKGVNATLTLTLSGTDATVPISAASYTLPNLNDITGGAPSAIPNGTAGVNDIVWTFANGVLTIVINNAVDSNNTFPLDLDKPNVIIPEIRYSSETWTVFGIVISFVNP